MQINFRVECPHCNWGVKYKDSYINKGFLKVRCGHCGEIVFFKITVMGVQVEVLKELPDKVPCQSLLSENEERLLRISELKQKSQLISEDTLYDSFIDIIASKLGINKEVIQPELRFVEDLKANSLDTVELIMAVEDYYDIDIQDEDAKMLFTVKEAYDYIFIRMFGADKFIKR